MLNDKEITKKVLQPQGKYDRTQVLALIGGYVRNVNLLSFYVPGNIKKLNLILWFKFNLIMMNSTWASLGCLNISCLFSATKRSKALRDCEKPPMANPNIPAVTAMFVHS